jgi:cysteinyl-tRNA synthetase
MDLPLNEAIAPRDGEDRRAVSQGTPQGARLPGATHEPRATEHIDGMVEMIQTLIDKGNAYVAGEARAGRCCSTSPMPDYGGLSKRNLDEQQAGARIAVEDHKKNPADFVLVEGIRRRRTRLGRQPRRGDVTGRPGWHIECSVMSEHHLGEVFDIHGGGLDLIFPHHENEIAQSCCAHGTTAWRTSGCTTASCRSRAARCPNPRATSSPSHELLETEKVGGRKWPGEVLRLAMLMTHYREPIDFSVKRLEEARLLGTIAFLGIDLAGATAGLSAPEIEDTLINDAIRERLAFIAAKNWAEADRIRDELLAKGIQLKDGKDPETGERVTTWEIKR